NQRRFANLQALASELHQPIGRLVLAYLLAFDFPVLPLIGPRNVADLEKSLQAASVRLSPEQRDALTA
ncbi:MAG TPA: aldo/keto reductase, partial [Chthoniobacterales bacterium]